MKKMIHSLVLSSLICVSAWPLAAIAGSASDIPALTVVAQEAQSLVERIQAGDIAKLTDADVIDTFKRLTPEVIASYLELGVQPYNEYELWMRREERLGGKWPAKPFLNHIKYRHRPRQLYLKWLTGGPKAGQEMIFDETRRKDALYGHVGGVFNVMSIWTPIDGALARSNSNHTVADLGLQSICAIVTAERALYHAGGRRPFPDGIEIGEVAGQRTVALTWVAPSARHYAYRTKVYLDLRQPVVRGIEAWDADGTLIERIFLDKIVRTTFKDEDFDPANEAYAF